MFFLYEDDGDALLLLLLDDPDEDDGDLLVDLLPLLPRARYLLFL